MSEMPSILAMVIRQRAPRRPVKWGLDSHQHVPALGASALHLAPTESAPAPDNRDAPPINSQLVRKIIVTDLKRRGGSCSATRKTNY
jgi:hypothetical protein